MKFYIHSEQKLAAFRSGLACVKRKSIMAHLIAMLMTMMCCSAAFGFTQSNSQPTHAALPRKAGIALSKFITVKGKVTDAEGLPLFGASVKVKGAEKGTLTNDKGEFELENVDKGAVLVVSFIGYKARELGLGDTNTLRVVLEADPTQLTPVTVVSTGYQTLSKERAAGSYSLVTAKDLSNKLQPDILSRLEGLAAGYTSYKGNIRVRGTSTLNGETRPLIVVDGFPYEGDLSAINAWEVESITVLKDATAASIYGARSANGIIVIKTRSGVVGRTRVAYNATTRFTGLPDDRRYLNLMNSRELVDFQQEMFRAFHTPLGNSSNRVYLNEVKELLYQREAGTISEEAFNAQLESYRNTDNRQQLIDNFLRRTAVNQNHNISLSGGSERYRYVAGANYAQDFPFEKAQKQNRIGYNFKNTYDFFSWLRADLGLIGSHTYSNYSNGFEARDFLNGRRASYLNLFDGAGNQLPWYQLKSKSEIDRLVAAKLYDETYYPLQELDRSTTTSRSSYSNLNLGLNFKLIKGLSFDAKYQLEKSFSYEKNYRDKDSYTQRNIINNATKIDPNTNQITYLVPRGGYIDEIRRDNNSYTLRGQFNYAATLNNLHAISAIAGGERRATKNQSTFLEKWGYDDTSLAHRFIDEALLNSRQTGTESLDGSYTHKPGGFPRTFTEREDRFVSFYGNASYEYDGRYILSASIRMDQSNLFGTDPKFQYRPLWSLGLAWNIGNEKFMKAATWVSSLKLRATYGINGNIVKEGGPFIIVADGGVNSYTQEFSSRVSSPANSGLRWEKTNQKNVGIDFSLFQNRLSGTIEYYAKNTRDLLDDVAVDPTSGWSSLNLNYASLYNRGYEISLNSMNVAYKDFSWNTQLNFSYNKNKVVKLEVKDNTLNSYIRTRNTRVGLPIQSLYSVRWAGLDATGRPQAFKEDGSIVKDQRQLSVQDLVYSGTILPPYAASFTNSFKYKGISLACMFIFYGGHVLRDVMPAYITNPDIYDTNINRNILNYWKKPGDELDPDKSPAIVRNASANMSNLWYAADKHILKADYLKLREVTFGYEFPAELSKKIGLSKLALNAQIRDLWYWSASGKGHDPESWNGFTLFTSRSPLRPITYALGLSAVF